MLERPRSRRSAAGTTSTRPGPGIPELRAAIAAHQQRFYGLDYDPDAEVLVTAGATEAIAAALLALCEPGDEVVMLRAVLRLVRGVRSRWPARSAGRSRCARADGRLRASTRTSCAPRSARAPGWCCSTRRTTRPARCSRRDELTLIAELCQRARPDRRSPTRCTSTSSSDGAHTPARDAARACASARSRSRRPARRSPCTGWKIGWVVRARRRWSPRSGRQAVPHLRQRRRRSSRRSPWRWRLPDDYFAELPRQLQRQARPALRRARPTPASTCCRPQGTYFVTVDIRAARRDATASTFCRSLPERCGVVAVPSVGVLRRRRRRAGTLVRFAFCKRDEVLDEAVARLGSAF